MSASLKKVGIRVPRSLHRQLKTEAVTSGLGLAKLIEERIASGNATPNKIGLSGRNAALVWVQLPDDLLNSLTKNAAENARSLNSELLLRLLDKTDLPLSDVELEITADGADAVPVAAVDRHQQSAYPLRLPADLRALIQASADRNGRSFNAEVVRRCAESSAVADMTLRDHFAGLAMQAAAGNPTGIDVFSFSERADWAYMQADAMLKARQGDAA